MPEIRIYSSAIKRTAVQQIKIRRIGSEENLSVSGQTMTLIRPNMKANQETQ